MIIKKNNNKKNIENTTIVDDPNLSQKSLFRVDEVADYFNIAKSTVYLWIDHGILSAEKYNGTIRIPRESILSCRFKNKINSLE